MRDQHKSNPDSDKPHGLSTILEIIHADICRYQRPGEAFLHALISGLYSHPALFSVIYYRIGQWLWFSHNKWPQRFCWIFYRAIYPMVRFYGGVEISPRTLIGPGLCIMHFGPTVIHPSVSAGSNLTIMHGVTIGEGSSGYPDIGNQVVIGVGASIIGGVKIGDRVQIGAGAVVTHDVLPDHIAIGVPARQHKAS